VKDAMVNGGIDESRISVVHSGIALRSTPVEPRDWRRELDWEANTVICGIVGAMTAEKGVDLVQSIGRAMPAGARQKARVILLGGTAGATHESGGLTVHPVGFTADIDPAIRGLDVLWHPSRAEGLGTSVIDAMSLGVPPLAFAVGGLPEVIENGVSGILVGPGDTEAFARAAAELIEDPDLRARLGSNAVSRAQTFDAVEMTKGTEAVYNGVLSG
jgi:glycosyltransferase involved in cell wall biosynthesis